MSELYKVGFCIGPCILIFDLVLLFVYLIGCFCIYDFVVFCLLGEVVWLRFICTVFVCLCVLLVVITCSVCFGIACW